MKLKQFFSKYSELHAFGIGLALLLGGAVVSPEFFVVYVGAAAAVFGGQAGNVAALEDVRHEPHYFFLPLLVYAVLNVAGVV